MFRLGFISRRVSRPNLSMILITIIRKWKWIKQSGPGNPREGSSTDQRRTSRISLEIGSAEAFVPAHPIFARMGFEPSPPPGDYWDDPIARHDDGGL